LDGCGVIAGDGPGRGALRPAEPGEAESIRNIAAPDAAETGRERWIAETLGRAQQAPLNPA